MVKSNKSELFEYDVCVCDRMKMKNNYLFPTLSRNENRKGSVVSEMTEEMPDISEIPETKMSQS